ncbi:ATP synthase subunit delta [Kordiimonas sediminis]|uniref:ATP synthase subunit delta n=1 Tax=Kordiimonas sediminis TaxID=1735581 RepID=A0A919E6Z7_9PROT|nr:F0F1 ATP synthase subunit delta [Kordiimonas sediminis]GHF20332.1 ATP synthase subunit delta [Kordiimonas sediminis]
MASHKSIVSGISGRYAVALFELALESKALEAVETDLAKLDALLGESEEFKTLVTSPLFSSEEQEKGTQAVAKAAELSDLTCKFLGVLAANRRLNTLKSSIADYFKLLSFQRGEVSASVVSAKKLTKKQLEDLTKTLKSAVGRDVAITADVDESLLGGLTVKLGSQMVDSSLKTKLDNLAIAMKGVQ